MTSVTLHTAEDVREFVEQQRCARLLSRPRLAELAICSRQTIYGLGVGRNYPRTDTLDQVLHALGVSYQYLPYHHVEPVATSSSELGERLRSLRHHFGLTQDDLGQQLGVSHVAVLKHESLKAWTFGTLYNIASTLGLKSLRVEY
ncbi:helix-turn-helix transcriptional regulator [Candidatus Woesearchaeota archaeon]|nr:helix-turn-helix transcriptional regulator [Candidatus Woesearchaeota archaeon]